ncbi:cellulose biosynthesis protein BcsG [Vibrio sp. YIC-376]|uniref:cellulose biosynthesis protein BcsG n=1 Tax=Vibrio sp. YIC-376 TaxID=3136162 RepID=UPI00402AF604
MALNSKEHTYSRIGLGWWNIYFIAKIALYMQGTIAFHPLENFALLLFIALPINDRKINVIRHSVALVLAAWLIHYDSYLPPLDALLAQTAQLMQFESSYTLELIGRLLSTQVLISFFVLCASYFILSKFLRVSVFVVVAMIYISAPDSSELSTTALVNPTQPIEAGKPGKPSPPVAEMNDAILNSVATEFFVEEASRQVTFNTNVATDTPFDILFLSTCSIAWDDIEIAGLADHPLFKEFDIMFDNFSTATSYSGPAVIRLLRASCGQQEHSQLFSPPSSKQCFLFDNLRKLGFKENLLMNHDGVFDNFLDLIKNNGGLKAELMSQTGLTPYQRSFDGSSIFRDKQVLDKWWQQRLSSHDEKVVALYNTISLHDGNRIINANSTSSLISYKHRLKNLLDDLYAFFKALEKSGRNIVVALVPEHGAGMRGDKMQISGMREIPAQTIVHTPVGIKIFGKGIQRQGKTVHIDQTSSYLAISQLVANILEQNIYQSRSFDVTTLIRNLPKTQLVAQNSGSTVVEVGGKYYVSLDGMNWLEYPNK